MAHNIASINGTNAFFGTELPWHKLGQIVTGARTWQDAMNLAQLNWSVSKIQLNAPWGTPVASWGIFRDSDKVMLGAVGEQYTPIQNQYAFEYVDALLEADNQAHYVSAGALGVGERIWCLAQINGEFDVTGSGDKHQNYLLFCTSHDGSLAATCKLTTVRVVCNNTLSSALRMNGEFTRVKHTREAKSRLEAAKKLVTNANVGIKELEGKLKELSQRVVCKDSFKNVMKKLFGDWEEKSEKGESIVRIENKIAEVASFYESNDKNTFPEIKGTAYNLLNAITEWSDHASKVRETQGRVGMNTDQMRAENALFGTGSLLKSQALECILAETANAKRKETPRYFQSASIQPTVVDVEPTKRVDNGPVPDGFRKCPICGSLNIKERETCVQCENPMVIN